MPDEPEAAEPAGEAGLSKNEQKRRAKQEAQANVIRARFSLFRNSLFLPLELRGNGAQSLTSHPREWWVPSTRFSRTLDVTSLSRVSSAAPPTATRAATNLLADLPHRMCSVHLEHLECS